MNRSIVLLAVTVAMCGCTQRAADQTQGAPAAAGTAAPSPQSLLDVKAKIDVPGAVAKGQPCTVRVQLDGAPPAMPATLAWYGPDGWLVSQDTEDVRGHGVTFTTAAGTFKEPGQYRAELRSGTVFLADARVNVTG